MQLASSHQDNSSLAVRYDELEAYIEVLAPPCFSLATGRLAAVTVHAAVWMGDFRCQCIEGPA